MHILEWLKVYAVFVISDWSKSGSCSGSYALKRGKGVNRRKSITNFCFVLCFKFKYFT